MHHVHHDDITIDADGVRTVSSPLVIDADAILSDKRNGSICVHSGTYVIAATGLNNGSVTLLPGTELVIEGSQNGSLEVLDGASVVIGGAHNGSAHVHPGGRVSVKPGGRLAGSLDIGGLVKNGGARGGTVHQYGDGAITDLPGAQVKQPEIGANGERIYRW